MGLTSTIKNLNSSSKNLPVQKKLSMDEMTGKLLKNSSLSNSLLDKNKSSTKLNNNYNKITSNKTTEMSKKLDKLNNLFDSQKRLLENQINSTKESNTLLEKINLGMIKDRKDRINNEEKLLREKRLSNRISSKDKFKTDTTKKGLFDTLKDVLMGSPFLTGLGGLLASALGLKAGSSLLGTIFSPIKNLMNSIKTSVTGIVGKGYTVVKDMLGSVGTKVSKLFNTITDSPMVKNLLTVIKESKVGKSVITATGVVSKYAKPVVAVASKYAKPVIDVAKSGFSKGASMLSSLGKYIMPSAETGGKVASTVGKGMLGGVGKLLGKAIPFVGAGVSGYNAYQSFQKGDYTGAMLNGVSALMNFIPVVGPVLSGLMDVLILFRDGSLGNLFSGITDMFSGVSSTFSTLMSATFPTMTGAFGLMSSGISGIFSTIQGYFTDGFKPVTDFVGNAYEGLKKFFNVDNLIDGIKNMFPESVKKILGLDGNKPSTTSNTTSSGTSTGVMSGLYNMFTGGSTNTTSTGNPLVINNSDLSKKTFSALRQNEGGTPNKIAHAIRGNSNFSFGHSQFDIGQRPDAWKKLGYSDDEIKRLQGIGSSARKLGSVQSLGMEDKQFIAQMQQKMYGDDKRAMIEQLDLEQEQMLSNKAKAFMTHLQSKGYTFDSESSIGQFTDIYNQFGSIDYDKATERLGKFSGGKKITSDAILKYRLSRENNSDQKRRFNNVEKQFGGASGKNLTGSQIISSFNSGSAVVSSPVNPNASMTPSTPQPAPPPVNNAFKSGGDSDLTQSKQGQSGGAGSGRMPSKGSVISKFGMRIHPIHGTRKMHNGIDLASPMGSPIISPYSGKVSHADSGYNGGYGKLTIVDHANGLSTWYAHQSQIGVKVGQSVQANEMIGKVGSTGASTGAHLHFETRVNGKPVDPLGVVKGSYKDGFTDSNYPENLLPKPEPLSTSGATIQPSPDELMKQQNMMEQQATSLYGKKEVYSLNSYEKGLLGLDSNKIKSVPSDMGSSMSGTVKEKTVDLTKTDKGQDKDLVAKSKIAEKNKVVQKKKQDQVKKVVKDNKKLVSDNKSVSKDIKKSLKDTIKDKKTDTKDIQKIVEQTKKLEVNPEGQKETVKSKISTDSTFNSIAKQVLASPLTMDIMMNEFNGLFPPMLQPFMPFVHEFLQQTTGINDIPTLIKYVQSLKPEQLMNLLNQSPKIQDILKNVGNFGASLGLPNVNLNSIGQGLTDTFNTVKNLDVNKVGSEIGKFNIQGGLDTVKNMTGIDLGSTVKNMTGIDLGQVNDFAKMAGVDTSSINSVTSSIGNVGNGFMKMLGISPEIQHVANGVAGDVSKLSQGVMAGDLANKDKATELLSTISNSSDKIASSQGQDMVKQIQSIPKLNQMAQDVGISMAQNLIFG